MATADQTSVPTFSQATKITPKSSHSYTVDFSPKWCVGSVPHGGYVTSCFQKVAALHFHRTLSSQNQPHCMTLHLEFLRRTSAGPALFTVHDAKLGKQTSTIHITLSQQDGSSQGRKEVVGYLTHTNLEAESGVSFNTSWSPRDPDPLAIDFVACETDSDPNWREMTNIPFTGFRQASMRVRWIVPRSPVAVKGCLDQWISLRDGREKFTTESVGFVADTFTQMIETYLKPDVYLPGVPDGDTRKQDMKAKFWFPTLLLNLEVKKALPAEGVEWLFVRVRTKSIKNGRYDLEVIILDPDGDLVGLSSHVCLAVSTQRNMQGRSFERPATQKL